MQTFETHLHMSPTDSIEQIPKSHFAPKEAQLKKKYRGQKKKDFCERSLPSQSTLHAHPKSDQIVYPPKLAVEISTGMWRLMRPLHTRENPRCDL